MDTGNFGMQSFGFQVELSFLFHKNLCMSVHYFCDPFCLRLKMNVKLVSSINFRESDQTVRFNESIDLSSHFRTNIRQAAGGDFWRLKG